MREISITKRIKVVKLFLSGLSYDDIAQQVGVAKGSVVYIINEFREGYLPVPPDMTEYVDTLRQLAVDLRKNNTSVAQIQSCIKIEARLKEMGVSNDKAEQWLDICQDIASPTVSSDQFVATALELAKLETENDLTYRDVVAHYDTKLNRSAELDREIEKKSDRLNKVKLQHEQEKEQTASALNSITKAIATAQDMFHNQKNDLKSQMDEYLAQNKLSWKKVNTAVTLFETELGKSGLPKREIDLLSERIRRTGSLVNVIKQLEQEKNKVQSEVSELLQEVRTCTGSVNELREIAENLRKSISTNIQKSDKLVTEIKSKRAELEELEQTTSQHAHNLYISYLIINFLFAPSSLSNYDLDQLVGLMIALRQNRLGIEPKRAADANGDIICACQVPKIYGRIRLSEKDIDNVRMEFAHRLTPMVKDKFISRFDYDMAQIKHETSKTIAVTEAILKERKKHLI